MGNPVSEDELEADPLPGYRNYLVYCDESGIHGERYYGFGTLWMPQERRGAFTGLVGALRDRHGYRDEIKWKKVGRRNVPFYEDLVSEFFKRNWLMFHCLLVRKADVDRSLHADYDQARRKHFAMLLKSKIKFFSAGEADKAYHVRVDPLPSRYANADEAAMVILQRSLKKELGLAPLKSLITVDSKTSLGVQVSDVLLGSVIGDWQRDEPGEHKEGLRRFVARHLGWSDFKADTGLHEWKFNIWHFFNPRAGAPREVKTRPVELLERMPRFRTREVRRGPRS